MLVKHSRDLATVCARGGKYAHMARRGLSRTSHCQQMTIAMAQQRAGSHCLDERWFKCNAIANALAVPSLSLSLHFRLSMDSSQDTAAIIQAASDEWVV